mgnify:CR=1 FL=1
MSDTLVDYLTRYFRSYSLLRTVRILNLIGEMTDAFSLKIGRSLYLYLLIDRIDTSLQS